MADSTMVDVVIEFHLAGARAELGYDLSPALRDSILTAHGLDSTRYAAAMVYYAREPEAYLDLYNRVLDHLSAERAGTRSFDPADLHSQPPPATPE